MAKFTPSLAGDVRGSAGGYTFSRNRFGNYWRRRTVPVNPNSDSQSFYRAAFGQLSSSWRAGLAPGLKSAWSTLASTLTLYDSMGNAYNPTGQNLFISNNLTRITLGEPQVTTPPAVGAFPSVTAIALDAVGDATPANRSLEVTLTAAGAATQAWAYYATAPLPRGVSSVGRSQFRFVGTTAGNIYTLDILSAWEAIFGPLTEGSVGRNIHVRVVGLSTGRYANAPIQSFDEVAPFP